MKSEETELLTDHQRSPASKPLFVAVIIAGALIAVGLALGLGLGLGLQSSSRSCPVESDIRYPAPASVQLGTQMKDKLFALDADYYHINHGSYGACPWPILEAERQFVLRMESNLDRWFRYELQPELERTRVALAQYLGFDVDSATDRGSDGVALIENASTGINIVVRALAASFGPLDLILQLNIAYPAVKKTLEYISNETGIQIYVLVLNFPITSAEIVQQVQSTLADPALAGRFRLCVFDHISSTPAVILPIKELIALSRSYNIPSVIDGAHALGQIPINLPELAPDFYYSNGHKWLLSAKGSAFLYVAESFRNLTHPLVISSSYAPSGDHYLQEFSWTGTRDYSNYLSLSAALAFRQNLTDSVVYAYNNGLCSNVSNYLTALWNTSLPVAPEMTASLINVAIPCNLAKPQCYDWSVSDKVQVLFQQYHMYVVIFEISGVTSTTRYVRLSCQIYNTFNDYVAMTRAFNNESMVLINQ